MTFFKLICVALYVLISTQIRCWAAYLNMMTDAFDDQYINCSPTLEDDIMPEILKKEQLNEQFSSVWDKAAQEWNEIKQDNIYPAGLKDEYGIAVIAYTSEIPYPIYKQFNGNMSIAGRSRDHYMQNFHFKALHFYLTRALRVLGAKDCRDPKLTFRGTTRLFDEISPVLRFGQFASTSLNITIAEGFGIDTFFEITTCFGVYIHDLSYYEEQELLIPVSEIFENVGQYENTYFLNSTGQQCSYFNCAYLGGEKLEVPMCRSGEKQDDPNYNRAFPGRILISEDIYLLMFFNFAAVKLMSTL